MYYNQGYQMEVIDPYYPPEIIEVMQPPPPVEVIMPSPMYTQPVVVVEQPTYGPTATGPSQADMECCLMLGACCVMEECGMCVIS